MPAARLTDRQKAEVVEKYRRGDGAQHLAVVFGCSPNTVIRAVKAALEPGEYERLKERRTRRVAAESPPAAADRGAECPPAGPEASETAASLEAHPPALEPEPEVSPRPEASPEPEPEPGPESELEPESAGADLSPDPDSDAEPEGDSEAAPGVFAIDDADDFGDDDDDLLADDEGEDPSVFVPVPLLEFSDLQAEIRPRPLEAAELPASAYMLVDKTVELQPRPLSEFSELGRLPAEEQDRRALLVFVNPRQAKRLCGRTQRVIKIPDTAVLSRTAPFLLAQGISRVVIEGALFALPGS